MKETILLTDGYYAMDNVSAKEEEGGELVTVFKDGNLLKDYSLSEIRQRIDEGL